MTYHLRDFEVGVKSLPIRIHWAGWETTTTSLQQAGWSLSAEEDFMRGTFRVAAAHPHFGVLVTAEMDFCYFESGHREEMLRYVVLNVQYTLPRGSRIQHIKDRLPFDTFKAIDGEPQFITHIENITSVEDLSIFATPLVRTEELIVDPNEVDSLMNRILELQKPNQDKFRRRQRQEGEHMKQMKFHAQIMSEV